MSNVKDKLTPFEKDFFNKLEIYLDKPIYFYGSILRDDYFPQMSDIDIDIFTDNEYSLMTKMQHYLHVSKKDFKKVAWIIKDTPTYGYKLKYKNKKEGIDAEFSIYNEKFKDVILEEHNSKKVLPIHVTILLFIIKLFYYQIPILTKKTYIYLKRLILNGILGDDAKFLVLNTK